jgi:hypothetical protein
MTACREPVADGSSAALFEQVNEFGKIDRFSPDAAGGGDAGELPFDVSTAGHGREPEQVPALR